MRATRSCQVISDCLVAPRIGAYGIVDKRSAYHNQIDLVLFDKSISFFNRVVLVRHEHCCATGKLDQPAKILDRVILWRQRIFFWAMNIDIAATKVNIKVGAAAADVDDTHFSLDQFLDQICVGLLNFVERNHRVIEDISGADLDANMFWSTKFFADDIDELQYEATTVNYGATILISSLVCASVGSMSTFWWNDS